MAISVTIALVGRDERVATYVSRRTFDVAEVTIGSDLSRDVCLPDEGVQPFHARLVRKGDVYTLVDESGVEGMLLDGAPLEPRRPRPVRGGEVVHLGPYRLELSVGAAVVGEASKRGLSLATALWELETVHASEEEAPRIEVIDGPDRRKRLILKEERSYALGRDPNADLPLGEPEASRRHARLTLQGSVLIVCDLGSSNGTSLQGKPLPPGEDVVWPVGAELSVGDDRLVYRDPLAEELAMLEERASEHPDVSSPSATPRAILELQDRAALALESPEPSALATPEPPLTPTALPLETELEAPSVARAVAAFARSNAQGAIAEPPPASVSPMQASPPTRRWLAGFDRSEIAIIGVAVGVAVCTLVGLAWLFFASD